MKLHIKTTLKTATLTVEITRLFFKKKMTTC